MRIRLSENQEYILVMAFGSIVGSVGYIMIFNLLVGFMGFPLLEIVCTCGGMIIATFLTVGIIILFYKIF